MNQKDKRVRVLFVCIGNACRSPMAEAIARVDAADTIEASSAGLTPIGFVAEMTRQILIRNGYSVEGLESKTISPESWDHADVIINMSGCPREVAFSDYSKVQDWEIEDPFGDDAQVYQRVLEKIRVRIADLAKQSSEILSSLSAEATIALPEFPKAGNFPVQQEGPAVPASASSDFPVAHPAIYEPLEERSSKNPFRLRTKVASNTESQVIPRPGWGMLAFLGVLIGLISLNIGWMEVQRDDRNGISPANRQKTEMSAEATRNASTPSVRWTTSGPDLLEDDPSPQSHGPQLQRIDKHNDSVHQASPKNAQRRVGTLGRPPGDATTFLSNDRPVENALAKQTPKEGRPDQPTPVDLSFQKAQPRPLESLPATPPQLESKAVQPANLVPPLLGDSRPAEPKSNESTMALIRQQSQSAGVAETIAILADPYPSLRITEGRNSKKQRQATSLQLGHLVSRVEPVYPEEARQQGIQGTVKLHALINRHGSVESLEPASGAPILVAAAKNAVQQWHYTETLLAGKSVETEEDIAITFKLSVRVTPEK